MKRCQVAAILGLHRSTAGTDNSTPTEYNHYEGALALAQGLPTLIITEQETSNRGMFFMVVDRLLLTYRPVLMPHG